jgi:hypothetical protein
VIGHVDRDARSIAAVASNLVAVTRRRATNAMKSDVESVSPNAITLAVNIPLRGARRPSPSSHHQP